MSSSPLYTAPEYRFCPECGGKLESKSEGPHSRPTCSECGFIFYHNPSTAVGGVIVQDGAVLLVKRGIEPYFGHWCLPAGFMEYGERLEDALAREILEETNLTVDAPPLLLSAKTGGDDPRRHSVLIVYAVADWSGTLRHGDDASDARWFPLDDLPDDIAFLAHQQVLQELKAGDYPHVHPGN